MTDLAAQRVQIFGNALIGMEGNYNRSDIASHIGDQFSLTLFGDHRSSIAELAREEQLRPSVSEQFRGLGSEAEQKMSC